MPLKTYATGLISILLSWGCGYTILTQETRQEEQRPTSVVRKDKVGPMLRRAVEDYERALADSTHSRHPLETFYRYDPSSVDQEGNVCVDLIADIFGRDIDDSLAVINARIRFDDRTYDGNRRLVIWIPPDLVSTVASWPMTLSIEARTRTNFTR